MQFSIFSVADQYPHPMARGASPPMRWRDLPHLAITGDRSCASAFWIAEHHFHAKGVCPSPPVLLAAVGARTARIRVGTMVAVLPIHNPVVLTEELALVDRLTDGRLNIGVGSGYIPRELGAFGVPPEQRRERFGSALRRLLSALRGEPLRADRPGIRLNVRPLQRPHPPLWIAAQQPRSVEAAGAPRGFTWRSFPMRWSTTPRSCRGPSRDIGTRRTTTATVGGGSRRRFTFGWGGTSSGAAAPSPGIWRAGWRPRKPFWAGGGRHRPIRPKSRNLEQRGFALFGSARDTNDGLEEYAKAGVDELLALVDFGGISPEESDRTVRGLTPHWAVGGFYAKSPSALRP